jgi:hypothetical protein
MPNHPHQPDGARSISIVSRRYLAKGTGRKSRPSGLCASVVHRSSSKRHPADADQTPPAVNHPSCAIDRSKWCRSPCSGSGRCVLRTFARSPELIRSRWSLKPAAPGPGGHEHTRSARRQASGGYGLPAMRGDRGTGRNPRAGPKWSAKSWPSRELLCPFRITGPVELNRTVVRRQAGVLPKF